MSWPLIFITLYQGGQRGLEWLTFTTLTSSLHHHWGSQNSHMLVSQATNQDPCPLRVDRRWIEEHETATALTKSPLFLFIDSDIAYKILRYKKPFSFFIQYLVGPTNLPSQKDKADSLWYKLDPRWRKKILNFLSPPGSAHHIISINVKREIRGLQDVRVKNKTQRGQH